MRTIADPFPAIVPVKPLTTAELTARARPLEILAASGDFAPYIEERMRTGTRGQKYDR